MKTRGLPVSGHKNTQRARCIKYIVLGIDGKLKRSRIVYFYSRNWKTYSFHIRYVIFILQNYFGSSPTIPVVLNCTIKVPGSRSPLPRYKGDPGGPAQKVDCTYVFFPVIYIYIYIYILREIIKLFLFFSFQFFLEQETVLHYSSLFFTIRLERFLKFYQ